MTYPTAIPSYGLIPEEYKKESVMARDIEAITTQRGIIPATSACNVAAISNAVVSSGLTLTVASGSVRNINSVTGTAGTCAITVHATGATHGQDFYLTRSVATGAVVMRVNAIQNFTASKRFGVHLKFIGAAWVFVSTWQEA